MFVPVRIHDKYNKQCETKIFSSLKENGLTRAYFTIPSL